MGQWSSCVLKPQQQYLCLLPWGVLGTFRKWLWGEGDLPGCQGGGCGEATHLFLQLLQPQSGDAPGGCPQWGLGPSPHPLEPIPGDLAGQGGGLKRPHL